MELKTYDMNLKVLKASYFNCYETSPSTKMFPRVCYDYELEYYTKCDGGILCEGKLLKFKAGDINIRKPGQHVHGIPPYECYIICFHATGGAATPDYNFGTPGQAQPIYQNPLLCSMPDHVRSERQNYVSQLFKQIYHNYQASNDLCVFRNHQLLYELMGEIFKTIAEKKQDFKINPKIVQVAQKIYSSFSESLDINQLIEQTGLSRTYFYKCFKQYTGSTPLDLIISLRLEKAKELLRLTNSPIADLAMLCGYDDPVYFAYLFKRQTGYTPTQYRNLSN